MHRLRAWFSRWAAMLFRRRRREPDLSTETRLVFSELSGVRQSLIVALAASNLRRRAMHKDLIVGLKHEQSGSLGSRLRGKGQ